VGIPSSNRVQPFPATSVPSGEICPLEATPPPVDISTSARLLPEDADYEDAAPSRHDLLQRAAELGPPRMTWASIAFQEADPILGEKMLPRVAERRERFRKIVKVGLGACVAFCMLAAVVSAISSTSSTSDETPARASSLGKTAPIVGVVPIEKLEVAMRTKAPGHVVAAVRPTPAPKFVKRR